MRPAHVLRFCLLRHPCAAVAVGFVGSALYSLFVVLFSVVHPFFVCFMMCLVHVSPLPLSLRLPGDVVVVGFVGSAFEVLPVAFFLLAHPCFNLFSNVSGSWSLSTSW